MKINKILFALIITISCGSLVVTACTPKQNLSTTIEGAPDIKSVIAAYLTLKDALIASDESVASDAAMELKNALLSSEDKTAEDARDKASAIAESRNLVNQRALFYSLSESVLQIVQESNGKRQRLYKQYCPMAFDNEGAYWLSDSKDIRNPYFGDKMLRCGVVKEKL